MPTPHPFTRNPLKTREDLQDAAISLLDPLTQHTSAYGARIKLGNTSTHYDEIAAQLEGFSRPLWALVPLLAGGYQCHHSKRWVDGLVNGTDPGNPDYWGESSAKDQRMVEMAAIGYALAVCPQYFWDPLSPSARENLRQWLDINDKEMPETNWLWFRVFANMGLMKVGAKYNAERLKRDLDHLDSFYLGDGWSRDGPEGVVQLDYYSSSFAIQYAQILYSKLAAQSDPERAKEYRVRAQRFAMDFIHYFDDDGSAIPFGRSNVYRFAQAAFWAAIPFADIELLQPLTLGVIKGILFRHLRWWSKQEAIFASDGTLTLGYTYPNMYMTENYNSPGSPYWCCKVFAPLALPSNHSFWTTPEEPYPKLSIPRTVVLRHPLHIVTNSGDHTFLLSSGQHCHYPLKATQAKYGKFAYSSAFGFSVPTGSYELEQHAADSMLAVSDDDGETWKTRRLAIDARIETLDGLTWLRSKWNPWPNVEVETILQPPDDKGRIGKNWHVRVHRLKTARKLLSAEGGWAIYGQGKNGRSLPTLEDNSIEGRESNEKKALAISSAGVSGVVDLIGNRIGKVINLDANANIISSRSVLPTLVGEHRPHTEDVLVSGIFGLPYKTGEGTLGTERWKSRWENIPTDWVEIK